MLCLLGNHKWTNSVQFAIDTLDITRWCSRCGKKEHIEIKMEPDKIKRLWLSLSMWLYRQ